MKYNKDEYYKTLLDREELCQESLQKGSMPLYEKATISKSKTRLYLLNKNNESGKSKAILLENRLGYTQDDWELLTEEIKSNLQYYPVEEIKQSEYGVKYIVPMYLYGLVFIRKRKGDVCV